MDFYSWLKENINHQDAEMVLGDYDHRLEVFNRLEKTLSCIVDEKPTEVGAND